MKYKISSNEDSIDVSDFEIIENTKTRKHLALGTFYVCLGFLISSSVYGLQVGDFSALQIIFNYVQAPMATLFGYYLGTKNG